MKIISWNVNGIRACVRKGHFFEFLDQMEPDVLCLQETKAHERDLDDSIITPRGYGSVWVGAEKKGYSGVSILTRRKPEQIIEGFGIPRFDSEARVISADFGEFVVFSVYFPNGQNGPERLRYKLDFYQAFFEYCDSLRAMGKQLIICGDYNTAHREIDLARPRENQETSGFLPVERAWLDRLVDEMGYVDTFRHFHPEPNQYSWWSYRAGARQRNVGWRIDYVFVSSNCQNRVKDAFIQQSVLGSDHCPVGIVFE